MHSNRMSIIIGLIILAIDIIMLILYASKQGKFTFDFLLTLLRGG